MEKVTLALLAGGISSEREVSLNSGEQVYDALDKSKYDVRRYDPKSDLAKLVADADRIDAALIILHGPYGEDGTVQGLLDLLDIPYQGSGVLGSAVAMNKLMAKQLYEFAGLPVAPYVVVYGPNHMPPETVEKQLGMPVVIKPIEAGSSVGMSIVRSKDALPGAMETAFKHSRSVMIEAYIDGIEVTCGVLGNDAPEALPLIEIIPDEAHDFFDYEAKYTAGVTEEICPARISERLTAQAQKFALEAHAVLQCRGYSRTDMMLREDRFYLLETNTIPGMTATSLFPQAARAAGYGFGQLLDRLVQLSIEDHKRSR
jgi:D-alanine-D-alanine ligase